eukprot:3864618-Pleurochrysis_carterae.AAC.3
MCAILDGHCSRADRRFSRSFVVGKRTDVCAPAMAVACGVSLDTFYDARQDCKFDRPTHSGLAGG